MKKFILPACILVIAFLITTCKKKNDESQPVSCSDGIQNQGETGVDCGGPCAECPTNVCTGNGSNVYFPLEQSNKWVYEYPYHVSWSQKDTFRIEGTQIYSGKAYLKLIHYAPPMGNVNNYYYRIDGSGNVYMYLPSNSAEYLLIPANPTAGQTLPQGPPINGTGICDRQVTSTTATLTTSKCTYTNCLKIRNYDSQFQIEWGSDYYVKGVGWVGDNSDQQLMSLDLN